MRLRETGEGCYVRTLQKEGRLICQNIIIVSLSIIDLCRDVDSKNRSLRCERIFTGRTKKRKEEKGIEEKEEKESPRGLRKR